MRRVLVLGVLFLLLAVLPLAGCGSGGGGAGEFEEWDGPPTPSDTGALTVAEFNDFLEEHPEFAWAPTTAATLFLRLDQATGTETLVTRRAGESQSPVTLEVTLDRLADDSVRAQRYVLGFELAGENEWRLTSAVVTQRCHSGRGHQDFSAERCV